MNEANIPASFDDLEKARKQENIVLLTAAQVMKDFGSFGFTVNFSGNPATAYEELHQQLQEHLTTLIISDSSKLKAILYQIDLAENQSKNILTDGSDYAGYLAERILDREFMKVLTRLYFKEKSEDTGLKPDSLR